MTNKANANQKTITGFFDICKNNSIQFQNSSYYKEIDGIVLEDYNIFRDRYYSKISTYITDMNMTDEQYNMYKYRPKKLSNDLYGTLDYWYIILLVNKMTSILDFNKKNIKVISYEGINYIKNVIMKEESDIIKNKIKVSEDIVAYYK